MAKYNIVKNKQTGKTYLVPVKPPKPKARNKRFV